MPPRFAPSEHFDNIGVSTASNQSLPDTLFSLLTRHPSSFIIAPEKRQAGRVLKHAAGPNQIAWFGGNMASPTLSISSNFPQQFTGSLIDSLIERVEKSELKNARLLEDELEQLARRCRAESLLTVDDVLDRVNRRSS
jgi:hypothetical protein